MEAKLYTMQTKEITIHTSTHLVPVRVGFAFVKHFALHSVALLVVMPVASFEVRAQSQYTPMWKSQETDTEISSHTLPTFQNQ